MCGNRWDWNSLICILEMSYFLSQYDFWYSRREKCSRSFIFPQSSFLSFRPIFIFIFLCNMSNDLHAICNGIRAFMKSHLNFHFSAISGDVFQPKFCSHLHLMWKKSHQTRCHQNCSRILIKKEQMADEILNAGSC